MTQAFITDGVRLQRIEVNSRQYPWDQEQVNEAIKAADKTVTLKIRQRTETIGFLHATINDENLITIHRLSVLAGTPPQAYYKDLLRVLTGSEFLNGGNKNLVVRLEWPEHEIDHEIFRYFVKVMEWEFERIDKTRQEFAYGSNWDTLIYRKKGW